MRRSTHDVRGGRDCGESTFADVDGESDERADERAKLEDGPEYGECLPLVFLERIGHHDGALRRPEQSGGDSEERASEDDEPSGALGLVAVGWTYVNASS